MKCVIICYSRLKKKTIVDYYDVDTKIFPSDPLTVTLHSNKNMEITIYFAVSYLFTVCLFHLCFYTCNYIVWATFVSNM